MEVRSSRILNVVSGEPVLFNYNMANNFEYPQVFKIEIEDADVANGHIQYQELSLIDNKSSEWEYWVSKGKAEKNNDYSCVDSKNRTVTLKGKQQANLLFKF